MQKISINDFTGLTEIVNNEIKHRDMEHSGRYLKHSSRTTNAHSP
jgi:hypothetical protein